MINDLLSDLSDLFDRKTYFLCPCCKCISTDIIYITDHIRRCTSYKTGVPIVVSND